jgi:hypothetical protein
MSTTDSDILSFVYHRRRIQYHIIDSELEGEPVSTQTAWMAKQPKKQPPGSTPPAAGANQPRRKPHKMIRIRLSLHRVAEQAAADLAQDPTQYINDALRERLERAGLWPPKPKE